MYKQTKNRSLLATLNIIMLCIVFSLMKKLKAICENRLEEIISDKSIKIVMHILWKKLVLIDCLYTIKI